MKTQFQSTETLRIRLTPFIGKTSGDYITTGAETVTLTIVRPDGTALPGGPHTATWDALAKMWSKDVLVASFMQGEWKVNAVSSDPDALQKWNAYYWGDYVDDITTGKTQATIAAQASTGIYERTREFAPTKRGVDRKFLVKLVSTSTGLPITGVAFGSAVVYYYKEGSNTPTLKSLTSGDWAERDSTNQPGYYDVKFSGSELDTLGTFFFSVGTAGSYTQHGRVELVDNIESDTYTLLGDVAITSAVAAASAKLRQVHVGQLKQNTAHKLLAIINDGFGDMVTGLAGTSVTLYLVKNGVVTTRTLTAPEWVEINSGTLPGYYILALPAGDFNTTGSLSIIVTATGGVKYQWEGEVLTYLADDATVAATAAQSAAVAVQTDVTSIKKVQLNRWKVQGTQLLVYQDDGTTVYKAFDLKDDSGLPSASRVFERVPV